ncbi:MAG: peptidoglycan DD-metalloendopeptidase family protein [Bacteroidales bacterium]|nr:peptidoglycan DD-metalloendopeptidase family protein [Bacteroidales bacterium]
MKTRSFLLVSLLFASIGLMAQENFPKYGKPVDIPIYLSATFGELRPNHLHAGLDIKTQAVEGKKIYAVADGYVSRIGVSPYGYGNVLYITHYDGYTSVYAHLQRFSGEIAKYVKQYQYKNKTFAAQIFPDKDKFPVKKGDLIAYSGNSGGSGGPHLHFEIRHTDSEKPVNPLYFGYQIEDNVKPMILGASVYPVGDEAQLEGGIKPMYFSVAGENGRYSLKDRPFVYANGEIAFGICTYDQVGTSTNKNGPYLYELYLDDVLAFQVEADSFSYSEPRYVNSLLDYRHYKQKKSSYVRTETDPNNRLHMIAVKNGTVTVAEGDTVSVCFKISDYAGNTARLRYKLVGVAPVEVERPERRRSEYFVKADGSLNSEIIIDDFSVTMEKNTLFRDEWIQTGQRDERGCCSRIYRFGDEEMTTFKSFKVRIRPQEEWARDSRMYIASIDKNGKVSSLGGKMKNGAMEVETRTMGEYTIKIDSVAPKVSASNFKDGQSVKALKSLRFKISDDMTGVDTYNIYLNDAWVLGQYDAKNALLYYEFDDRIKAGTNKVKVVVTDGAGNTKTLNVKVVY